MSSETKLVLTESLTIHRCITCGGPIAFAEGFEAAHRLNHEWFYCPAGHPAHYAAETDAERLRKELTEAQELANAEANKRRQLEGLLAASDKRREQCPVCNKRVQNVNLKHHMAFKHP